MPFRTKGSGNYASPCIAGMHVCCLFQLYCKYSLVPLICTICYSQSTTAASNPSYIVDLTCEWRESVTYLGFQKGGDNHFPFPFPPPPLSSPRTSPLSSLSYPLPPHHFRPFQIWYTTWAWGVACRETTFTMKIGRGPS